MPAAKKHGHSSTYQYARNPIRENFRLKPNYSPGHTADQTGRRTTFGRCGTLWFHCLDFFKPARLDRATL